MIYRCKCGAFIKSPEFDTRYCQKCGHITKPTRKIYFVKANVISNEKVC